MKRLITYCFLTVTLILCVATTTVYNNKTNVCKNGLIGQHQSLPGQSESNFSNSDFLIPVGLGNGQNSLLHTSQSISSRTITSLSNTGRINHLVQLQLQQFAIGNARFLLQSAFKQSNGYYLYHLRKLLI